MNLVKLVRSTGNRLLFDINIQLRFGNQWDPSNAIDLFEFFSSQGFCDIVDWELGNGWLFCFMLQFFLGLSSVNLLEVCLLHAKN